MISFFKVEFSRGIWITLLLFIITSNQSFSANKQDLDAYIQAEYDAISTSTAIMPTYDIFKKGLIGYLDLQEDGKNIENEKLTLIDFRLASTVKRMWVIDIKNHKVLFHVLVAHGKNTGENYAKSFSNIKNSNQSSLGFYLTGETYTGKHGLSLRLDGMEVGFNDRARTRAIVMHGAAYVSQDFIKENGRLGRSFGCPAVSMTKHKEIIRAVADHSVLFIYSPSEEYISKTKLNDSAKAVRFLEKTKA